MAAHRHHGVVPICRALQVAPSAVRSAMARPVTTLGWVESVQHPQPPTANVVIFPPAEFEDHSYARTRAEATLNTPTRT